LGKVLQVVSVTKTDIFTISANTQADITGLAVTITPSLATSKILVTVHVSGSSAYDGVLMLYIGSSIVAQGDAAGVRHLGVSEFPSTNIPGSAPSNSSAFLDSPATTSAITYKMAAKMNSQPGYINRSTTDANAAHDPRTISTIYVMEIGA
jgi:hypothetical protein